MRNPMLFTAQLGSLPWLLLLACDFSPSRPNALNTSFAWRRSAASPIICVLNAYFSMNHCTNHSATSLEASTVTSSPCAEALIPSVSSESDSSSLRSEGTCLLPSAQAKSPEEPSMLALRVLSSVTGVVQAVSQHSALLTARSSGTSTQIPCRLNMQLKMDRFPCECDREHGVLEETVAESDRPEAT